MRGVNVQPYLFFDGRCEEALEFYREAVGARVSMMMRYNESPDPPPPETLQHGFEDKVMHATMHIGQSTIMASDGVNDQIEFGGFSLSIAASNTEEAEKMFAALADGGTVTMPLTKTFWSPMFGMLTDKFGLAWMVSVSA